MKKVWPVLVPHMAVWCNQVRVYKRSHMGDGLGLGYSPWAGDVGAGVGQLYVDGYMAWAVGDALLPRVFSWVFWHGMG